MAGLLSGAPPSIDEQRANNRHRAWVPAAVLCALAVYVYLFTPAHELLGLPSPFALAKHLGLVEALNFDEDNLLCELFVFDRSGPERLAFLVFTALAFLWVYLSPVRLKRPALVAWFLLAGGALFGLRPILGLLVAHLAVYLCHHPRAPRTRAVAFAAGALVAPAFLPWAGTWWHHLLTVALSALFLGLLARFVYDSFLAKLCTGRSRAARAVRLLAIQSPLLTVTVGALQQGVTQRTWILPVGILVFFWQWERLMMYAVDYKDGRVPEEAGLWNYLSIFLSPGAMPNFAWGVTIGQGYGYLESRFLCSDKNRLALRGLALWGIALVYLVAGRPVVDGVTELISRYGPAVGTDVQALVRSHVGGLNVSTASVLFTSFFNQVEWFLIWGGVLHFKVGLWRVLGYDVDPYFRFPFLATNLVSLWTRLTFHYREFLVRVFYYPVFFRLAGRSTWLRVAAATFAAAGVGNLIWGHLSETMYLEGARYENFDWAFRAWPYYVLLPLGITLAELWLLWKPAWLRRKPWSPGWRMALDVVAVYLTFQFYSLIHIFYFQWDGASLWDHTVVFLRGLGLA